MKTLLKTKTIYLTKEDALHEAKRIIKIFNTKGGKGNGATAI